MKSLKESLIKSYDTNKLISIIYKRYPDIEYNYNKSKSKEFVFSIYFNKKEDYDKFQTDIYINKQLDLFGYYITENINKELCLIFEPNFGTKCTNFVYEKCNGLIFYVTSKEKYNLKIKDIGLKSVEGNKLKYRYYTERVFFSCGESKQEIIDNINFLINQFGYIDPIILMINLKENKYNVDFYYDPSEDEWHNFIYCNAYFPDKYITRIYNINDIELNIDENLNISNIPWKQTKRIFDKYISDNKFTNL